MGFKENEKTILKELETVLDKVDQKSVDEAYGSY